MPPRASGRGPDDADDDARSSSSNKTFPLPECWRSPFEEADVDMVPPVEDDVDSRSRRREDLLLDAMPDALVWRCATHGCDRPRGVASWSGVGRHFWPSEWYDHCCRTCRGSLGQQHGPWCDWEYGDAYPPTAMPEVHTALRNQRAAEEALATGPGPRETAARDSGPPDEAADVRAAARPEDVRPASLGSVRAAEAAPSTAADNAAHGPEPTGSQGAGADRREEPPARSQRAASQPDEEASAEPTSKK